MNEKLEWNTIHAEHVTAACERILSDEKSSRSTDPKLYVEFQGAELPAKQVLRLAYCLAKALPASTKLKFSSGDGSLRRLRSLGFIAKRRDAE